MKARMRAGGAAVLLLFAGAVLGIAVDRTWNSPTPSEARSLTAGAMAERLGLTSEEEAQLNLLLDSVHTRIIVAAEEGPEALRLATEAAHRRIEASLPPGARDTFHAWMQEHREHMMHHLRHGTGGPGMMHRARP
jgi:hypothetical protein